MHNNNYDLNIQYWIYNIFDFNNLIKSNINKFYHFNVNIYITFLFYFKNGFNCQDYNKNNNKKNK